MTLILTTCLNGVLLPVKAKPNSRADQICGVFDGMLKVSVTATPEKGRANQAIIAVLARTLAIPKTRIELINGMTSTKKTFLIRGINAPELLAIFSG